MGFRARPDFPKIRRMTLPYSRYKLPAPNGQKERETENSNPQLPKPDKPPFFPSLIVNTACATASKKAPGANSSKNQRTAQYYKEEDHQKREKISPRRA